ncbi:MAG: prolipoprotein diacylglyceryl transferase [Candidatus Saccharibacteria bacterium]
MKKRLTVIASIFAGLIVALLALPPVFSGRIVLSQGLVLGDFTLRWYGLILAAAVLIGYWVARRNSWRFGIGKEEVDDVSFWLVLVAILSARVYYVLSLFPYFAEHPAEIVKIWHGGLSIYGALIGGTLFLYLRSRRRIYSAGQLFDLVALGLPLAQAFGRLGNFFNYEAFGLPTTLPWKMYVPPAFRPLQFATYDFFHPTFLYEMIWNLIVFAVLWNLKGRVKHGVLAMSYLGLYSVGRFFIEPLRLDASYVGNYHLDQLVAFSVAIAAMISIFFVYSRSDRT